MQQVIPKLHAQLHAQQKPIQQVIPYPQTQGKLTDYQSIIQIQPQDKKLEYQPIL